MYYGLVAESGLRKLSSASWAERAAEAEVGRPSTVLIDIIVQKKKKKGSPGTAGAQRRRIALANYVIQLEA